MRAVKSINEAMPYFGADVLLSGQQCRLCSLVENPKGNIMCTFQFESGLQMKLDAQSCLEHVTLNGVPMGV